MQRFVALALGTFGVAFGWKAAMAKSADAAGRTAYYAVHYPGEHGPFADRGKAIDAALIALNGRATTGDWACEWLIIYSRDRYGAWWYNEPKEGHARGPNECVVSYSERELRRPGSRLMGTAHNHPRGDVFPDPRPSPLDNQNDQEMFLLRHDGGVWYFPPHETHPKLYGRLREGAVESLCRG